MFALIVNFFFVTMITMLGLTEEEIEEIMICLIIQRRRRRRRHRKMWIHPLMSQRYINGHYYNLIPGLRKDPKQFHNYFRMSASTFDSLLALLQIHIAKKDSVLRASIPAEERLALTLR